MTKTKHYTGCNRNYTSPQGRIYMSQENTECYRFITVSENSSIFLYFQEFSVSSSTACENAGLEVRENGPKGILLQKTCGYYSPNPIFSSTNQLWLYSWNKLDFAATYDLIYTSSDQGRGCGGFIYNYKGTFSSPLYPIGYKNTTVCMWDIRVPIGRKIAFQFKGTYCNIFDDVMFRSPLAIF